MINPLEKVRPRVNHFDYKNHPFFVYVYLNPFKEVNAKYKLPGQYIEFAYEPIYIGKGSNGAGYRHNQHIAEYLKNGQESQGRNVIHNETKRLAFKHLEQNMKKYGHTNVKYPRNWQEYQKDWVIILKVFDSNFDSARFEKNAIKNIGTIRKNTGPLVNALLG